MPSVTFVLRCGLVAAGLLLAACTPAPAAGPAPTPTIASSPSARPAASPAASPAAAPGASPAARAASPAPSPSAAVGASPAASASPASSPAPAIDLGRLEGGGGNNVVRVNNRVDGRFMARGSIDLVRVNGDRVSPTNAATAESSCTDCQSIAVAVQVVLYRRGASVVTPQNLALALNQECTRCVTAARAVQYVIPVDDPKEESQEIKDMVKDLDKELRYFESIRDVSQLDSQKAQARLQSVLDQYASLKQYLDDLVDQATGANTPSPTPVPARSATPAPTAGTPAPASVTVTATAGPAPGGTSATPSATAASAATATLAASPATTPGAARATTPSPTP